MTDHPSARRAGPTDKRRQRRTAVILLRIRRSGSSRVFNAWIRGRPLPGVGVSALHGTCQGFQDPLAATPYACITPHADRASARPKHLSQQLGMHFLAGHGPGHRANCDHLFSFSFLPLLSLSLPPSRGGWCWAVGGLAAARWLRSARGAWRLAGRGGSPPGVARRSLLSCCLLLGLLPGRGSPRSGARLRGCSLPALLVRLRSAAGLVRAVLAVASRSLRWHLRRLGQCLAGRPGAAAAVAGGWPRCGSARRWPARSPRWGPPSPACSGASLFPVVPLRCPSSARCFSRCSLPSSASSPCSLALPSSALLPCCPPFSAVLTWSAAASSPAVRVLALALFAAFRSSPPFSLCAALVVFFSRRCSLSRFFALSPS